VGEDQLPHLELTREIARRFNYLFGEVFPEPQAILTKAKVLPGTDGRKMSKSYGNTIALSDSPDTIRKKVSSMITDPARIRKDDPGHPEVCTVFSFHKVFNEMKCLKLSSTAEAEKLGVCNVKRTLLTKWWSIWSPYMKKGKR